MRRASAHPEGRRSEPVALFESHKYSHVADADRNRANQPRGAHHVWRPPLARSNTLRSHAREARYGRRMARLGVSREVLASMLRQHGEDDLAERALSLSDDELARIGTLGAYYAFSEDAMALGGSVGGARALSLAAIDVLESTGHDLRWSRTEQFPLCEVFSHRRLLRRP
jgi:hypothetical protein